MLNEDTLPAQYKYAWTAHSEIELQNFLVKYNPSMVQNDGTKPWIWVHGSDPAKEDTGVMEAVEEATELLEAMTDKIESIKNDDTIPIRSNKKTGAKSKKELREQLQAEASEKLKEISVKHGCVSGKWLIFAPADKIHSIWSGIATSLVSGALRSTPAHLAKVSTSSDSEHPNGQQQHLICVYIPDVYDVPALTQVMRILLRNHGVNLSGVKSNLYTMIGLDSKHPSGIPSTVWKNSAVLPEKEIKELKDAYFASLASGSTKSAASGRHAAEGATTGAAASGNSAAEVVKKQKPKLKKKIQDDPFASSDEDQDSKKDEKKTIVKKAKVGKNVEADDDSGKEAAKPKSSTSKPSRTKAPSKRTKTQIDEEDEDERPKKRRSAK